MNDDQVSAALKSLPREAAGIGFAAGVRRRIEDPPPRRLPARWATAAAAAVLVLTLGFGWRQHRERQAADLRSLLAEKQALEVEMAALRRLTAEARPTVYLGSDDEVDLVLDLARFRRRGGFGSNSASSGSPHRPADHQSAEWRREQPPRPLRAVF